MIEDEIPSSMEGVPDHYDHISVEIHWNQTVPRIVPTALRVNYTYSLVSIESSKTKHLLKSELCLGNVPDELGVPPHHPFICSHSSQFMDLCKGDIHASQGYRAYLKF